MRLLPFAALAALSCATLNCLAGEIYGGAGSTGLEIGLTQNFAQRFAGRFELNTLNFSRKFNTSNIDYDAKLKFSTAGAYVDYFLGNSFRVTGGALLGSRKIHGSARSVGNTIRINGVTYPVVAGDSLDFDAKFPNAAPYIGIGWGHQAQSAGLHFYADAGVAFGQPDVTLTPSASLASKINPADLAAEQNSAQDKANSLRNYPVLKFGLRWTY